MRPVVCMITDRSRIAAPSGKDDERVDHLVTQVALAARAGVHLVQIRERDLDGARLLDLVRRCLLAVRATRTRVVVNDRLDVALAAGAHGVHLRGDSMPAARVRELTPPGFLVGRSVHQRGEAAAVAAAGGLDYLIYGPVFSTESKPDVAPAGPEALDEVATASGLPVLAVGGITATTAPAIAATGAAGWAAIGLFVSANEAAIRAAVDIL